VRRIWPALGVLIATAVGFVAGFLVAFAVMVESRADPECDGPCFSDPWVAPVSYGAGAVSAILFGFAAWRYFAKPS
jgi:hypothetical protein